MSWRGLPVLFDRGRPANFREYTVVAVIGGLSLLFVYGSVLTACYGLRDDYAYLWVVTFGPQNLFNLIAAMGRPLYQWLSEFVFARADTVCRLAPVRAVTLATTVVLLIQVYALLRRRGWALGEAGCVSWLVCTTPAIGLFVGWAITFPFVAALSLGLAAGELAWLGTGQSGRRCLVYLSCSAVLLYAALNVYQHSAMAYWLAAALVMLKPDGIRFLPWRRLLVFMGLFGLINLIYFAIFKWQLAHFMAIDPQVMQIAAVRTHLVGDPVAKLMFLKRSLLLAASIGQFVTIPWLAAAVIALVVFGWLVAWWRQRHWQSALLILSLPILAYLPSVVASEDELKIRLFCVLSALVLIYLVWALIQLAGTPRRSAPLLLALMVWSGLSAHAKVTQDIVNLHVAERHMVTRALRRDYSAHSRQIAIVRPEPINPLTGGSPLIEYGTPTAAPYADFARVLVQQLFSETFHTHVLPRVLQCKAPATRDCSILRAHPTLPVIDLSKLAVPSR